jgi:spore coat polysaccharide biosynthesis predicted glycosyltransferase SpsG
MRYILRADASQALGSGHVMRSSAIAEELIARGEEVIFIGLISDLPWVKERISTLGFSHHYIRPEDFISDRSTDILLLDSYEISVDDPFISLEKWHSIFSIVDETTPDYSCTLRIHPGLDSNWVGNSSSPILAGPKYIPFRRSLYNNTAFKTKKSEGFKIIVVAGGSDPYGLVFELSNHLTKFVETFEVYLFTNSMNNFAADSRFHFCDIGASLEEVSLNAHLILTTSSTSSLEFIAQGHCVGVVCTVDNQKQYYEQLGQLGVAAQIGTRNERQGWNFDHDTIHKLITDSGFRTEITKKATGLLDFEGARRIVDLMMPINK